MLHDLRIALRQLLGSPGFALAAIVTLALGIGANTAIFSVVDGVLLRSVPVDEIERLAVVWETDRNSGTTREPSSVPDFLDFQRTSRTFSALGAVAALERNMALPGDEPVRLASLGVSHELLPLLGLEPIAGRSFSAEDDRTGSADVALISDALWQRSFGRDPAAIGDTVFLDEVPHTIIGVMPEGADFGALQLFSAGDYARGFADRGDRAEVDVWLPLRADPETLPRQTHLTFVVGRLAPGATMATAHEEMETITADLERAYPENDGRGAFVEPLGSVVFGPVRPALRVLLVAVGLVLLVACVNVANLLLARHAARTREIAIRSALGAGRGRILRQFLVESLVLVGTAAALGTGLAFAALRALLAIAPPDIPRLGEVTIDLRVLGATLVVSAVVALAFGLVPMLQARRTDVRSRLHGEGARPAGGLARWPARRLLVVAELALAVLLVVGAGLLIRSFWHLQLVDAGFRPQGVLKAEMQLPQTRYPVDFARWPDFREMHDFAARLLERAAALPGAESVALAGNHPLDAGSTNSFVIVGREAEARDWPEISQRRVSPGYFETVGLGLVDGRLLRDSDTTAAPPVALLNQAAVRRFFGDRDPLGAQIAFWGAARTIVGTVADEKFFGLGESSPLAVYLPLAQAPSANGAYTLLVRAGGDPTALGAAVTAAVRDVDPALAVYGVEPLDDTVARSISQPRFTMLLLGMFAALALLLAAVGIHGVLANGVARRRREIGIRLALGARPSGVLRLVVGEGLRLAAIGLAVGMAAALLLTRLLGSLLFGLSPTDPMTYLVVVATAAGVALLATVVPAWRASRVDPITTLRSE